MNNTELRIAFDTLLKKYHERGIDIQFESNPDTSYYPTIAIHKSARGFVHRSGERALDVLFDIGQAEKLIAEKIDEENLDIKAWELQNAGYTVIPPAKLPPSDEGKREA